jgi:hypothetical protein
MRKYQIISFLLTCFSFVLFAEGQAGNTGAEATLSGIFAVMDASKPLADPADNQYPGLYLDDGTRVRLEGDISRQLAYGSDGQRITVKGYYFSAESRERFVVTELISPRRKGE